MLNGTIIAGVALRARSLVPPLSGAVLTTLSLVSPNTQSAAPFWGGIVLARGAATNIVADLTNYQIHVLRTWPDGSIKHAQIHGRASLVANTPLTVSIRAGTPPTGTALTLTQLTTAIGAAGACSVQCGALGTVTLSSLTGSSPFRIWVAGAEAIEAHWRADVASTGMSVWFHTTLLADGRLFVRAVCENGYLDNGSGSVSGNVDRSFVPTFTINGSVVYNNGGSSQTLYNHTRGKADGWVGTDPQVTTMLNPADLRLVSKMAPGYAYTTSTASQTTWNDGSGGTHAYSSYTYMATGDVTPTMESEGFGPFIGLMPVWNAAYLSNTVGTVSTFNASIANSSCINGRAIVWRDKTTNLIPKPSDFATWTITGPSSGGADSVSAGSNTWEIHHAPNEGYLAYMLTGEYWHYETMAMCASTYFFFISSTRGSGVNRQLQPGQLRGIAWAMRTLGSYCALAPTGDAVAADYRTWLSNAYTYYAGQGPNNGSAAQLGYPVAISTYDPAAKLSTAPWMYHFWIQAAGFVSDIDPGFASNTDMLALRDWMYKGVVGLLGSTGSTEFYFTQAGSYNITISNDVVGSFVVTTPDRFYADWGQVWTNTGFSSKTGNTLQGTSGSDPANAYTGYWGNLMPAIAYAVDHGASGAAAAYARLTGASNWSTVDGSGFADVPIFGIKPR